LQGWIIHPSAAGCRTLIRGGFGIFSDLSPAFLVSNVFNNAPYPYTANIYDGSTVGLVNNPGSAAATALAQYNTFKSGFFSGQTLAQLQNELPTFSPFFNYFGISQKFKTPNYCGVEFWSAAANWGKECCGSDL
jgi:hypothetical protein